VQELLLRSREYYRTHTSESLQALLDSAKKLKTEQEQLEVARVFYEFLNLANLAEKHHRIRRYAAVEDVSTSVRAWALMGSVQAYVFNCRSWRAYRRGEGDLILKHTMNDAFATLKEKGVRSSEIRTALMNQRVELVLTAHPTQAVRRTMLHKLTAYALPRRKKPDGMVALEFTWLYACPCCADFAGWANCWRSATGRT